MLESIFNPESIAVIGASRDPRKVGYAVLHNLIQFNFGGGIYPINPSADCILGLKTYPSVPAVGKPIGLAVIAVPARAVPDALLDCAVAGTGAAVILSAGFKEVGAEGMRLEEKL